MARAWWRLSTFHSPHNGDPSQAWQRVLAPLRFLSRIGFDHFDRVKGLDHTLANGLSHLAACDVRVAAVLAELHACVTSPPKTPAQRVAHYASLWQQLRVLHAQSMHKPDDVPPATTPSAALSLPEDKHRILPPPTVSLPEQAAPVAAAPPLALQAPLQFLKGVGPKLAAALQARDLHTVEDLLRFLPRRYQGRSAYQSIADLRSEEVACVEGEVQGVSQRFVRGRRRLEVVLSDGFASLHLVWFRIAGRAFAEQFVRGKRLQAAGTVKRFRNTWQIVHPEITPILDSGMHTEMHDDIVPLYLDIDGVHPKHLRRLIHEALAALPQMPETLPAAILAEQQLVSIADALQALHQPPPHTDLEALQMRQTPWHTRLIFEELFYLQLGLLQRKAQKRQQAAPRLAWTPKVQMQELAQALLPFTLTDAQARVLREIQADLGSEIPMQRLLQGDVGSGKTAVAFMAAAAVAKAGLQTALMAPTELLAEQHARSASKFLHAANITTALLTGHTPAAEKRRILAALAANEIQVVIGTHALIQQNIAFAALGLAVIDEQHRFGVLQRARLTELGMQSMHAPPHMLVMTATPIPRTLALTAYGDLDVSVIDMLPPGRSPIRTEVFRETQRAHVYEKVRAEIQKGRQAYVVFPLVEDSDKEGMVDIRAATSGAEALQQGPLKDLRLGLLHGRLSVEEKDAVMQAFVLGEMDVLIATTVVEVGIDVPNATVMVVEHAERFGLSQLHQLRGRVGRGQHASTCLLLTRFRPSEEAWRRLSIMAKTQDGFRIAEEDLAIRGPGDFVGTRQSGLPILSLADLVRDQKQLVAARAQAQKIIAADPMLEQDVHAVLKHTLAANQQGQHNFAHVG